MPDESLTRYRPAIRFVSFAALVVALILLTFAWRALTKHKVTSTLNCLDKAASAQQATSALTAVDKYAACAATLAGTAGTTPERPPRCRFAGVWTSTRGNASYQVTLNVDGSFTAEPGAGVPPNEPGVTGAWSVAGNALAWAYDSGAVWPPDINPIFAESEAAFSLREVNGTSTRFALVERSTAAMCIKK
jgi:hypothetical protein